MLVFPLIASLISLVFCLVVFYQYFSRRKPYQFIWGIALLMFGVAAGCEVLGTWLGWNETLVRLYYLFGATLNVAFLGLGTLYLMAPPTVANSSRIALALLSILAVLLIWSAPIDADKLVAAASGWKGLHRAGLVTALSITLNTLGSIALIGGALYSAWVYWKQRIYQNRLIGNVLIAVGALTIASGGLLTRLGQDEYLYIAMAVGITVMFLGFLKNR